MLIRERVEGFANKVYLSKAGIWAFSGVVPKHRNVLAVLYEGGWDSDYRILIPGSNIVTNDGDEFYAENVAAETHPSTNTFTTHEMQTAGTPGKTANRSNFTAIASTLKLNTAGYPKTTDADTDNTGSGADIVTHLGSYTKADFNATAISHGIITNPTPGASEQLLTGYAFAAPFGKTANDTLKVFVNHEILGV